MNNLQTDIASELELVIALATSGELVQPATQNMRFRRGYFSSIAIFWLTGNTGYLQEGPEKDFVNTWRVKPASQRHMIALANICIEIDQRERNPGRGQQRCFAERQRQIQRNRTLARDLALYKHDELKRFALHRLTGEGRFYPFPNPAWRNDVKQHDDITCLEQAGALLIAHIELCSTAVQPALSQVSTSGNVPLSSLQGNVHQDKGSGGGGRRPVGVEADTSNLFRKEAGLA